VLVTLGQRLQTGYVLELLNEPDYDSSKIKPISDTLDPFPLFTPETLRFCRQVADYYVASIGETLRCALPPGINFAGRMVFRLSEQPPAELPRLSPLRKRLLQAVREHPDTGIRYLSQQVRRKSINHDLRFLLDHGLITGVEELKGRKLATRKELYLRLSSGLSGDQLEEAIASRRRRPAQVASLKRLSELETISRRNLLQLHSLSPLRSLLEDGLLEQYERDIDTGSPHHASDTSVLDISLNREQKQALSALMAAHRSGEFKAFLLQGVTGSGKTQVYLEAIKQVVENGKQALVLVPEISLTPQIVARFNAFFGDRVIVMHSRLSDRQRYDAWLGIRQDKYDVVVGVRSAVFAPLERIGMIVVDEEHDSSFKQFDPAPRYNARDAALLRGRDLGVPVLLGSATPALETYHNVAAGRLTRLLLPERTGAHSHPEIELIDMKEVWRETSGDTVKMFSNKFISGLLNTLERGEQAIILQNRRGYSSWQQCVACGTVAQCPNCDITLTYHKTDQVLRCHYCGHSRTPLTSCEECGSGKLEFFGTGTQQVEEQLQSLFPEHRLLRMDQDTTRSPDAYNSMIAAFNANEYDILLGTQSVAKGHDFPRVTFVGVVNADTELALPDFRAQERTFQLLTQVAGRAGRADLPGRVIIQTFRPENRALQQVQADDMEAFLTGEAETRRQLNYPPFSRLGLLTIKATDRDGCRLAAEAILPYLQKGLGNMQLLGPAPAPIQKIWREYRYHYIVKSARTSDPNGVRLRQLLRGALDQFNRLRRSDDSYLTITVDPLSLM
jgi:primosomal protein N' (replication factor Y)